LTSFFVTFLAAQKSKSKEAKLMWKSTKLNDNLNVHENPWIICQTNYYNFHVIGRATSTSLRINLQSIISEMIENLIIIWSWPAGHTAAIYAARADLKPLMFEGLFAWGVAAGGQLTTTTEVENFPGFTSITGPALMNQMREQSIHAGTRILTQTVDSVDLSAKPFKVVSNGQEYFANTLIIATGATAKKLEMPGLEQYRNNGISWCAVCDGALPIFRNKVLAVIGGWDVAMEEAMHLAKFGSKVYVLVRTDKLRASKAMQERVLANEKIEILRHTECTESRGDGDLLNEIQIINNQTKETSSLAVGGLFFAIWHTPNTAFLNGQVSVDENGYIITYNKLTDEVISGRTILTPEQQAKFKDGKQRFQTSTSVSGVFAAWDCADKVYRQAITSAGTGCAAALEAEKWLQENL
jgi:thioredoxin reductase (NADPH)